MKKLFVILSAAVVFTSCNTKLVVNNHDETQFLLRVDKNSKEINFIIIAHNAAVYNYTVSNNKISVTELDSIQSIYSSKLVNLMIELQYINRDVSKSNILQKDKDILFKRILNSELLAIANMNLNDTKIISDTSVVLFK